MPKAINISTNRRAGTFFPKFSRQIIGLLVSSPMGTRIKQEEREAHHLSACNASEVINSSRENFTNLILKHLKVDVISFGLINSLTYLKKKRTSVHENQLIMDLFTQTLEKRRLKRIWPEDLLDEV
jgi:hypothetical protein